MPQEKIQCISAVEVRCELFHRVALLSGFGFFRSSSRLLWGRGFWFLHCLVLAQRMSHRWLSVTLVTVQDGG